MTMIALRPARPSDSKLLWSWRNAPDVRAIAFSTEPIPWEQHQAWFERKLNDPHAHIFVAQDSSGHPFGQIRFDVVGREAEVHVALDSEFRGRGLGTAVIGQATDAIFEITAVTTVSAYVKLDNSSSIRAFEKAGYEREGTTRLDGTSAAHLRRNRPAAQEGG